MKVIGCGVRTGGCCVREGASHGEDGNWKAAGGKRDGIVIVCRFLDLIWEAMRENRSNEQDDAPSMYGRYISTTYLLSQLSAVGLEGDRT